MDLHQALWWLSIASECAALASILLRRIARPYVWFALYLAFGAVRGIGLHFAGNFSGNRSYAIAWIITDPILLVLLVLATLEVVGKVPSHYRGFGSFGKQKLRRLLEIAIAAALLSSSVVEAT